MIHRNDIGRPISIMRADQVRAGDFIVSNWVDPTKGIEKFRVKSVEHVGDDVIMHMDDFVPFTSTTTSIGNAVIVVR